MAYTRPAGTVLDFSDPGGDTYATAWDKNSDAVDSVLADLNTHEALTATHGATGAVVGTTNTQTLTNKTLTSPKINENVAVTATATEINKLTGCTSSTAELNKLTGLTPSTADLNQLAGATLTDPAFDAYADNAAALAGASAVLVMNPVRTKEAIAAFASPEVGQCRFDYVNATTARLNRYNGYLIKINGTFYAIPSAGVDFAVGASSSTFYYAYAYMDGATMKGELSATAPVADTTAGNEGVQIKTGDATRTLVGWCTMNSSTQYDPKFILSWFNQQKLPVVHVREEQASGTAAGTFTSGAYRTRLLNTVHANTLPGASLASNRVSLPAGKYRVRGWAVAYAVDNRKTRLQDVTNAVTLVVGESIRSTSSTSSNSWVQGEFILSGTANVELQDQCSATNADDGFGFACSFGENELYSELIIEAV